MKPTSEQKQKMQTVVRGIRKQLSALSKKVSRETKQFSKTNDKWGTIGSLNKVYADLVDINQFLN